jgi:hypothetical protein
LPKPSGERAVFAALIAVLVVLAACTPTERAGVRNGRGAPERPRRGGSVVFGVVGAPATLDPYAPQASDLTYALVRPLYPSLYRFLPDGSTEPYLAEEIVSSGRRAVLTLKPLRWSDGRRVTARDVVLSARRARRPSGFAAFDRVRAVAARRVELIGRVRHVERALATAAFVLPRGAAGKRWGGPLAMRSHRPGLEVVYEANPRWSGARPYLQRVTVRFVQSEAQLLLLLERGQLDAAAPLSATNLAETIPEPIAMRGALGWETVVLDFEGSELARPERAAIAGALDRAAIEGVFVRSAGRLANTTAPGPGSGGAEGPWPGALARRRPPAGTVDLSGPAGDALLELVRRAAYTQLSQRGMDVDAVSVDPTTFYSRWDVGAETDVAIRRRSAAPPWRRVREGVRSLDSFPLLQVKTFVAWRPPVRGLAPNPTVEGPLWNVERWWRAEGA